MGTIQFVSLESEIKESEELLKGLDYKKKTLQRRILTGVGTDAKNRVKRNYRTLLNKRSGNLYKSVKRVVKKDASCVTIHASAVSEKSRQRYGYILAAGADIKAKDAEYLTFKIGDKWIRKKEVIIKPHDYIEPPVNRYLSSAEYDIRVEGIIDKYINQLEEKAKS